MKYKKFKYKKYKRCYFEVGSYFHNSKSMFITIENKKDGILYYVTEDMPDYFYTPNTATIDNYSDNSGMTEFLQELGIIKKVYSRRKIYSQASDRETLDLCLIDIEKLKKYSRTFSYEWES